MVLRREIVVDHPPVIYPAIELIAEGKYICLVLHCSGKASTKWNFWQHFLDQHPKDLIYLPSEGSVPLPRCKRCGMQTERGALYGWHQCTQLCQDGWDKKVQHEATETARVALAQLFTMYGDKLERVEVFKYLGWLLVYDDKDTQAMRGNLKTARKSWGQVSCVLRAENASPKVCGVFYKATVQAVLLFGSEMWKLSPLSLKSLEGFHIRAAHCMAGNCPHRIQTGRGSTPAQVGLQMIDHYICVHLETIARFIMDRLLFALCWDGEWKRGSARCTFWWEQPLSIDVAESLPGDEDDKGDDT
jgi:hypothetical protein